MCTLYDLHWFSIDSRGQIGSFSSAGSSFVPESFDIYDDTLFDFFDTYQPEDVEIEIIEENLPVFYTDNSRHLYLRGFTSMSKKGLYSYDTDNLNGVGESGYLMMSKPLVPLNVRDLPNEIRKKFEEYKLIAKEVSFEESPRVIKGDI